MLSHKKYNELVSAFVEYVHDEQTVEKLVEAVKQIMNYSPDQKTYNRAYYDNFRQRLKAAGQTTWDGYQKQYYEKHKKELNEKRMQAYYQKKNVVLTST